MNPITRLLLTLVLLFQIHALAAPGDVDPGFVPPANLITPSVALLPDGRIIVGGTGRLFTDGTLDAAYSASSDTDSSTAIQFDGKVLLAVGTFTGQFILRLNTDDTLDTTFVAPAFDLNNSSNLYCTALQDDGRILIGGHFATTNSYPPFSLPRSGLARLLPNGSVDPNFEGGGEVRCIAMQSDGKFVVASVGTSQNFVTRLTPVGNLDPTLNLELTGNAHEVRSLVIQPDGKILVAGSFTALGGTGRNGIARINTSGALDPPFSGDASDRR